MTKFPFLIAVFCLYHINLATAQTTSDTVVSRKQDAVHIYIDCNYCDMDYLRTTITFVNYVRDRAEAQVHILVTAQPTGGGGREYTITFIGKQNFKGIDDTLKYVSRESDTDDMIRTGIAHTIKLGLIRYVAKTPLRDKINISYSEPAKPTDVIDPWDFWVFQTRVNSFLNGQSTMKSMDVYGSLSANRVTPALKIKLSVYGSYGEQNFDINTTKISSFSRSRGFSGSIVFSLTNHWSTGLFTSVSSSTFSNEKFSLSLAPAIEYNIFPYEESTRRELLLSYRISFNYVKYETETIFLENLERLYKEGIKSTITFKEPWGSIAISAWGSHYFHDLNKYSIGTSAQISLRLIEGLSLEIFGNASKVRDQLSLPKRGATMEEILLRQRQLATQYNYWGSIGFSYTFGSIYTNVVNTRFGSEGGRYSIIIH